MASAAPAAGSGAGGKGSSAVVRVVRRTYSEFVWSVCFGLVAVASVPLVAGGALALGAFKSAGDSLRTRSGRSIYSGN
ncbi:hypothetical protein Rsub_09138 [Raphidocelis subcapitata]|uniref:Uncharacterized protein n=1 Tax=Raphidocelis subcapitata TaxID=307507 RepID=A0A2V0PHM6_9CHLO|nr:hypothetical protein Rsub_09138 [Raphidocelis subcapitata]|eukprot:GBF96555.1 hypothetical protein Rsub_09138 [Raphidocelis subcapitata]